MDQVRIKINHELLAPSEESNFEGVINNGDFVFAGNHFRATEPIQWNVKIFNSGSNVLLVTGDVQTSVEAECVRCLEPAAYDVDGEIEGYVALNDQAKLPEEVGEDEVIEYGDDHSIDIAPLIEGAITLELPLQPLCRDDCPGIDYNHGEDFTPGETHPFEILKNYKFD